MNYLLFVYRGTSRDLKRVILAILRSWFADDVKKFNYVNDFSLVDKRINKKEEKIVLISTQNEIKLIDFVNKKIPQLEKIKII